MGFCWREWTERKPGLSQTEGCKQTSLSPRRRGETGSDIIFLIFKLQLEREMEASSKICTLYIYLKPSYTTDCLSTFK